MRSLFRASKWLHKWLGLLLLLFLAWMSLTGVMMNHPGLIAGFTVPGWLIPPQYDYENWNRNALTDLVFSPSNPDVAWAAGKPGVWITRDGGAGFEPFMEGLPTSGYYRKTRDLLLVEHDGRELLLAGCDGGLFLRDVAEGSWREVDLAQRRQGVRRVITTGENVLVATDSRLFRSSLPPTPDSFREVPVTRDEPQARISLVRLFFDLHYGKAWGIVGVLLFDAVGLILFFLCVSAFYTWYFPWQSRRNRESRLLTRPTTRRLFKTMFRYHLKLGIWISAVLLIIGGTGLFMRPPLLAAIVDGSIPRSAYPGLLPDNPWDGKIRNLLYDDASDTLLIDATDGVWAADGDLTEPFRPHELEAPIFVMGATVFETDADRGYLVGSFSGLFSTPRGGGTSVDLITGEEVSGPASLRPGDHMVTGFFRTPGGERYVSTFEQGLLRLRDGSTETPFAMPPELEAAGMPLWNYLFEIHNGRFFADVLGAWHLLIIPLGSLLFLVITISGVYDWIWLKVLRPR